MNGGPTSVGESQLVTHATYFSVTLLTKDTRIMAAPKSISLTGPDGALQTFSSLAQACTALGQPYKQVHKRLHYLGWPPEKALGIQPTVPRNKPVTIAIPNGRVRHFASEREASRALGVPYLVAYRRLRRGWTPEQAFEIVAAPRRESPAAKEVVLTVGGETLRWRSLAQAAIANGLIRSSVKDRIRRGWTLPQALGLENSGRPPHKIATTVTDNGVTRTFESITEAANAYRFSVDLVNARLHTLKWTVEEALGIVLRPGYNDLCYGLIYIITHTESGRQYVGQTKEATVGDRWELHILEAYKNSKKTVRPIIKAIQTYGPNAFTYTRLDNAHSHAELNEKEVLWIERLKTLMPNGFNATRGGQGLESCRSVEVGGVRYKTLTAASEQLRVPLSSASRWLKKGTPEQAFGLEPKPKRKSSRGHVVEFTHEGKKDRYASLRAAADAHGVSESNLQRRLKDSWSIQEALELVERPGAKQKKPVRIRLDGEMVTYVSRGAAARSHGLSVQTFLIRIRRGWSTRRALLTPAGKQGRRMKQK